jgi:hypothetical protein
MLYEEGMQIIWDVMTRTIVVIFRGDVVSPPERFNSRADAKQPVSRFVEILAGAKQALASTPNQCATICQVLDPLSSPGKPT